MRVSEVSLVGHSHSVCMLDGLGNWRTNRVNVPEQEDKRYSQAFQGWFSNDLADQSIELELKRETGQPVPVKCFPIFEGSRGTGLVIPKREADNKLRLTATPTFTNYLREFTSSDVIISTLFGNEHARYIYINDLPAYDFIAFDRQGEGLKEGVQPIDRQHILNILEPFVIKVKRPLQYIQAKLPEKHIVHLLPPPPLKDMRDASVSEVFEEHFEKHGQVDEELRLKWYGAYCLIVEKTLTKSGIRVLSSPKQCLDQDGFLLPKFAEGLTHGNAEYGKEVWAKIDKEILN